MQKPYSSSENHKALLLQHYLLQPFPLPSSFLSLIKPTCLFHLFLQHFQSGVPGCTAKIEIVSNNVMNRHSQGRQILSKILFNYIFSESTPVWQNWPCSNTPPLRKPPQSQSCRSQSRSSSEYFGTWILNHSRSHFYPTTHGHLPFKSANANSCLGMICPQSDTWWWGCPSPWQTSSTGWWSGRQRRQFPPGMSGLSGKWYCSQWWRW